MRTRRRNKRARKHRVRRKTFRGGSDTKIKFFHWWNLGEIGTGIGSLPFFSALLNGCIDTIDEVHVYGSIPPIDPSVAPETSPKILRIQFSGEVSHGNPGQFDINSIAGVHPNTNNFLTIPFLSFYMHCHHMVMEQLTKPRVYYEHSKFCLFSVSNPKAQERIHFFHELSKYKHVDSCGKHLKNVEGCPANYESKEYFDFIKPYKFMICFENTSLNNYLTEKIFNAYHSGAIPIYWGCPNIDQFINMDSILYLKPGYTEKDVEKLIAKIKELDEDEALYKKMFETSFLKAGKIPDEFRIEVLNKEMCKRIKSIERFK